MLPVATVEHYCWIVSSCQTYNSSVSARLSRQINYTERNKTWLFTRLSPTGPLSTHSSVVFDQCIREILVLGFHFRANVHNEYLLLICFRCFPELIQCFVLQHHYRLGFTTKCTTGELNRFFSFSVSHSSGAVWESRWTSWAVRPNEPSGFRGRQDLSNRASALVTTCP